MSTFSLKILALVFMSIDHLGEFFPQTTPIWFRWLGRISAPLFFFCASRGIMFTHDKKAYILRLYGFSVIMGIGNFILTKISGIKTVTLCSNIFATIFLFVLTSVYIDTCVQKERKEKQRSIYLFAIIQIAAIVGNIVIGFLGPEWSYLFTAIFPNLMLVEGGAMFVFLGCVVYNPRIKPLTFSIMYILFSAYFLFSGILLSGALSFSSNYQWMMVAALPMMLAWNKKQGPKLKYLFYIFYPAHIWILYLLSI